MSELRKFEGYNIQDSRFYTSDEAIGHIQCENQYYVPYYIDDGEYGTQIKSLSDNTTLLLQKTSNQERLKWTTDVPISGSSYGNNFLDIRSYDYSTDNRYIAMGIGDGGVNRGLWVRHGDFNGWMIYHNGSQVILNNGINSPTSSTSWGGQLTGIPTTSTQAANNNNTNVASTAFVQNALTRRIPKSYYIAETKSYSLAAGSGYRSTTLTWSPTPAAAGTFMGFLKASFDRSSGTYSQYLVDVNPVVAGTVLSSWKMYLPSASAGGTDNFITLPLIWRLSGTNTVGMRIRTNIPTAITGEASIYGCIIYDRY